MKSLRNPIVVAALALVASVLLFETTLRPIVQRQSWSFLRHARPIDRSVLPVPAGPDISRVTTNTNTNSFAFRLEPDVAALRVSSERWVNAPRRDPFDMELKRVEATGTQFKAMQLLKLTGIWRQTGGSLVVINEHVLGLGETVLAYRIDSIESDRVWVQGPNGREALEFQALPGPSGSISPATSVSTKL